MPKTVEFELCDSVGTLRIRREDRHNALGAIELNEIGEALNLIEHDDEIRVLIVTGSGSSTFCSGAALDDLNSGRITPDGFQQVMNRLATLRVPSVARINGSVFGGGSELALSCDFRIGVEGARLRVPAAAIGLCYPPPGIARFVEKLGANAARRILLASETLYADELLRLGFLDYLVPPGRLDEKTEEIAMHIAGLAPLAARAMKELIQAHEQGECDPDRAAELARLCQQSADLQEGFAAQKEKRAPHFEGR
jgi:enoyl-CoA hydratase/carnithine racemase